MSPESFSLDNHPEKDFKIEESKKFILSNKEYAEHPFAHSKESTYVFELKHQEKHIVFFGSAHINDPENRIFDEIQAQFNELNPQVVYVEMAEDINRKKPYMEQEAKSLSYFDAKKTNESTFTLKLAVEAGIEFESPEPSRSDMINYLVEQGHVKKDIYFALMYRNINQYIRENKDGTNEGCKKHLEVYCNSFERISGWDKEELESYKQDLFDELDIVDVKKYRSQTTPVAISGETKTPIKEIIESLSPFREAYIFEKIAQGLEKYDRVFVVYGNSHAVKQEPALRALIRYS